MITMAIAAERLQVARGGTEVLHGVRLALPAGRWTAVVGPNGAGKTTLLKALARLLPYRGEVRLMGREAGAWSGRERARLLAWLGQNEGAAHDLLAWDVVMLGRLPHQSWLGAASAADRTAVEEAMRETQCWHWRERALGSLSGGERQRVLLARALAVRAPLLLMDEPLANLDPPHQADWLRIVRSHVQRGGTAVTVLHEITMALHADDMLVMDGGQVVHQGACSEPATHRALEQVFQGRISVHAIAGQWVALPNEFIALDGVADWGQAVMQEVLRS
ncbi:ABC transporter ATP-binding protein [Ramlibacter sp. RBP-2]|uniref:ABC transporter ATP-binding protein n=1 Tax=Ramlibacter lithotrophicus TaxID=2606681 RepID=A0A7X6DEL1_9BURK|nr:ABC transporter ATP-binding protein [Ramlibacter lithotrophicus]NKE65628.1 ABC transporter ATP-binding protein [Ramlibacter lithotrophicus]